MKKYKIGDVAKILGVTTDTLRYYEKENIVTPHKDDVTNYRYYDFWDINYLIDALWYRSFGFSVKETAKIIHSSTREELYDFYLAREDDYRQQIKHLEMLLRHSEWHRKTLELIRDNVGVCEIADRPERVHFINRYTQDFPDDPRLHQLAHDFLKYMPFTHRYFETAVENISLKDGEDYTWGMEMRMDYVEEFGLDVRPPLVYLESCKCIHSYFTSSGKGNFSSKHVQFMIDFARENGLEICGNASGILIASILDENEKLTGYFEVWIPIK